MKLRPFQKDLWDDPARFKCAVVHRRAGKTFCAVNWLLDPVVYTKYDDLLPGYRGFYVCPYAQQARDISWVYFTEFANQLSQEYGLKHKAFRGNLTITWEHGAQIQLLGTEYGADKLRGRLADRIVMDETAHIGPAAWTDVLRPMLSDREGEALAIGTPAGRLNHFYKFYKLGLEGDGDWSTHHIKASESGIIPQRELDQLRREMGDRAYEREYECSFDAGAAGSFFEEEMGELQRAGRVFAYQPDQAEVHTSWHFGPSSISVAWVQMDTENRPVFFKSQRWEHARIEDVAKELKRMPYRYGRHYCGGPHLKQQDHRLQIARDNGISLLLVPSLAMSDATQLVKAKVMRAAFGPGDGVEAMKTVHARYDDLTGTYTEKAVEDLAFELAMPVVHFYAGHNDRRSDWSKPIYYPSRGERNAA